LNISIPIPRDDRAAAGADRRCCKEVSKLATLLGRAAIARQTRFEPPVLCPRRALQCCCTTGRQCCSFTTRLGRSRRENIIASMEKIPQLDAVYRSFLYKAPRPDPSYPYCRSWNHGQLHHEAVTNCCACLAPCHAI
jgi:hypothetical protein